VIAALLVEIGLVVTALPFVPLIGDQAFFVAVPIACVVVPFVVVWLATRKLRSGHVLHGLLIGIVATLMYFALVIGTSSIAEASATYGTSLFVIVNSLRLLSAVAGGYVASRRPAAAVS
jgi:lipopolysaccharide export LptBFGC system permease protein LptF